MKKLLHGEVVISPNPKIISSIIKQSEYLDEELLTKVNNKFYTPDEFNNALQNLNMASQLFSMHLSYHRFCIPNWVCKRPKAFLTFKTWRNQQGGLESTVSPPVDSGQSPGRGPSGKTLGSSAYLGLENLSL